MRSSRHGRPSAPIPLPAPLRQHCTTAYSAAPVHSVPATLLIITAAPMVPVTALVHHSPPPPERRSREKPIAGPSSEIMVIHIYLRDCDLLALLRTSKATAADDQALGRTALRSWPILLVPGDADELQPVPWQAFSGSEPTRAAKMAKVSGTARCCAPAQPRQASCITSGT